jgi:hypothetical protein
MASAKGVEPSKRKPSTAEERAALKAEKSAKKSAEWRAATAELRKEIHDAKPKLPRREAGPGRGNRAPGLLAVKTSSGPGGPSIVCTPELQQKITDLVAAGASLDSIGKMPAMPSLVTMLRWIQNKEHPFSAAYYDARDLLVTLYEERVLMIATTVNPQEIVTTKTGVDKDGNAYESREVKVVDAIERSRLAADTYKWVLGGMRPKKWGRQVEESTGGSNAQLEGLFAALKSGPPNGR